jgi:hypothetical protein
MIKLKLKRKVIASGYTKLISLPLVWIDDLGISKGDSLSMIINDSGNLEIIKNETNQTG